LKKLCFSGAQVLDSCQIRPTYYKYVVRYHRHFFFLYSEFVSTFFGRYGQCVSSQNKYIILL